MNYIVVVALPALLFSSCASYKKPNISRGMDLSNYSGIDQGSFSVKNISDFPRKVLKNKNFSYRNITSDTSVFKNDCEHSLFISGGYDRKNKHGFALFHVRISDDSICSQCILFNRFEREINVCIYNGPGNIGSWNAMRPFLTLDHQWLFWGFTMNKKEQRRWNRHLKFKRFFKLKS